MTGRRAREIADDLEILIDSGELPSHTQMPTLRAFAEAIGVSVGTVMSAWNILRNDGRIQTRRRGGTIVTDRRSRRSAPFPGWSQIDLSLATPDYGLQPDLSQALLMSLACERLNRTGREYITPELRERVEAIWPFEPQAWNTAGGGSEALMLATEAAAPAGSVVAVEEPVTPGYLDTLIDLGLRVVGVAADDQGPTPQSLHAALARKPATLVLQPSAGFALEGALTTPRAAELANIIGREAPDIWVLEDDATGALTGLEAPSLGTQLPDRVLRIRSYCKAYGIDVRTSVLGGARELVERTIQLRSHGIGSNSRILQNALAYLIDDPPTEKLLKIARTIYANRRDALVTALQKQGLTPEAPAPGSLVIWLEVQNETATLVALAHRGITVGAGGRAFVSARHGLLRISPLQLPDDPALIEKLAAEIRRSLDGPPREYFD
ncbi:aminotransferase class I/II-fold pyridoxal phosphate-dependent enzyme [Phytohabitans kaempferiae]|uniref:Aminotransferase class I/II-fold pyridoxal phosphate-dependent enzyme n=1 Tax=Phytohabitans kaempferiae TaxID=1620943 RepID=A0ABV6MI00_9ACTN